MPDRPSLHDPYICHNREDLVRCLEQYAVIRGQPKVQRLGMNPGGDGLLVRYDIMLRQNIAIDRAMSRLRWMHNLSFRLLDAYYREGMHEEAAGWERALLRARLPHHPQTYRERQVLETVFAALLNEATDSLWHAHTVRPGRILDGVGRR